MYFLMVCRHHDGVDEKRSSVRDEHRKWVVSGGEGSASVLIGSATLGEDGRANGNFGVLEAKDAASARAFAEGDPYNRRALAHPGRVAAIEITPLPDTFQAHRISEPMTKPET